MFKNDDVISEVLNVKGLPACIVTFLLTKLLSQQMQCNQAEVMYEGIESICIMTEGWTLISCRSVTEAIPIYCKRVHRVLENEHQYSLERMIDALALDSFSTITLPEGENDSVHYQCGRGN